MKTKLLPLYKFFTLNQNFYNTIINQSLWFSRAKDFNDPFDCNFILDDNPSFEDFCCYCEEHKVIEENYDLDLLKHLFEAGEFTSYIKAQPNEVLKIKDEEGICCFAKRCDNLLMWSHYGNSHKGICIQFDFEVLKETFELIHEVRYQSDYPHLNIFKSYWDSIRDLHTIKSLDWEYEKEVRIIKDKPGLYYFKPEAIKTVYFGVKTTSEEKLTVIKLVQNFGYRGVNFVSLSLKKDFFGLDMTLLKITPNGEIVEI